MVLVTVELTWHWWKPSLHMALVEPMGKSSFLEISSFLGDLGPDCVTGRLGWLEWVESKEIAAWDDWDQLPSSSSSSSTPAACHLADAQHEKRAIPCIFEDVALNLRHVFVL